jgi:hypothetical protein
MKRLLLATMLLASIMAVPIAATAGVNVQVNIGLPPPIVFAAPPEVVVIPGTYVYVVPDVEVDLFFWNGWWWRLWDGRWYRSHYYNRGWAYYNNVPRFYFDVDPGWREHYRHHDWYGRRWNYERIPAPRLQRDWSSWQKNRYWGERQRTWGVQNFQPHPPQQRQELRRQRQEQYHQRPEVQQHQRQRTPQFEQPGRQHPERGPQGPRQEQYQRQEHQRTPQFEQPRQQHQGRGQEQRYQHEGRPEGGEERHGR